MTETIVEKQQEEIITFVKDAFCVDGSAKMVLRDVNLKKHPCVEVIDKKRGKFLVLMLPEK